MWESAWQAVWVWGLALSVLFLVVYHLRLRGFIRQLTLALRGQDGDRSAFRLLDRWLVPGYVRVLAREIAQQLQQRSQQRAREEELQQIIDSVLDQFDDGFLEVGEDLSIRYANAAACETFAQVKTVIGRKVIEVFLDHRIDRIIQRALDRDEKASGTVQMEKHVQQRGEMMGRVLYVEAAPVTSPLRSQRGAWVILRDESQRYHLEQVRKDFVANASHELRTPLSIICGYLENLVQGTVDDTETVHRFHSVMLKHANRLGRIVEDMLAISKLESSPGFLKAEPFDLAESVIDMVEHLQPLIQERGARVLLNLPEEDRSIFGERAVWDQVFFNLIENSLRQNEAPGLEVEVRMRSDETHHDLEVVDNGVGIPTPHLSQIFKRFYRVERHHSRNQVSGTGLGLSIVKRAVEAHGGTIGVSSVPGMETRFFIRVPRRHLADGDAAAS
jgi:two-component system, OmpR family, phosphate regulon sensor histidine kinase PhoR